MNKGDKIFCIDESVYGVHITKRKEYEVVEIGEGSKEGKIRVKGNIGRLVWIDDLCFSLTNQLEIKSIKIDDKIVDPRNDNVEVTITFKDKSRMYTTFMTPINLVERIEGNEYYTSDNVIFINEINKEIIEKTIHEMDRVNKLFKVCKSY